MPKKNNSFIAKLQQLLNPPIINSDNSQLIGNRTHNERTIKMDEINRMLNKTTTSSTLSNPTTGNVNDVLGNAFSSLLMGKHEEVSSSANDCEKLLQMFPELEDGINLRVASILSANNFLNAPTSIKLHVDSMNEYLFTEKEKESIEDVVTKFFTGDFKLNTKLHEWLGDVLKTKGSQPVLVLPFSTINQLRNMDITNLSTESLITKISSNSIGEHSSNYVDSFIENCSKDIDLSMESLNEQISSLDPKSSKKRSIQNISKEDSLTKIKENLKDTLIFEQNPAVLFSNQYVEDQSLESLEKNIFNYLNVNKGNQRKKKGESQQGPETYRTLTYKESSYIDLNQFISDEIPKEGELPLIIELPAESVIPLTRPGNPKNHIGYFVLLNDQGEPIVGAKEGQQQLLASRSTGEDTLVHDLYSTVYGTNASRVVDLSNDQYFQIYKSIYNNYIQNAISTHLKKEGIENVSFDLVQDTLYSMLSQILEKKQTRLLFIPKSLMTYIALRYNSEGIGTSITNDIKFILSLKINYLITKMLAMTQDMINTKVISFDIPDGVASPEAFIEDLKKIYIENNVYSFSSDPVSIMKNLAANHLILKPNSIPNVENFSLDIDSMQKNNNQPDNELGEMLDNMVISGIGIPPSAMEQLKETDFATAIVTQNIFFAMRIEPDRRATIEQTNHLIRNIIRYHPKLLGELNSVLEEVDSKDAKNKDIITTSKKMSENTLKLNEIKIKYILDNISLVLPEGKIANHKAVSNEFGDYIGIIETITDHLYPDDQVTDELQDIHKIIKSHAKTQMIKRWFEESQMATEFNFHDISKINPKEIVDEMLYLLNLKGMNDHVKHIVEAVEDPE